MATKSYSDIGDIVMLATSSWWQFLDVSDRVKTSTDENVKEMLVAKIAETNDISNLSPTQFVSNIRHQHQSSPHETVVSNWDSQSQSDQTIKNINNYFSVIEPNIFERRQFFVAKTISWPQIEIRNSLVANKTMIQHQRLR